MGDAKHEDGRAPNDAECAAVLSFLRAELSKRREPPEHAEMLKILKDAIAAELNGGQTSGAPPPPQAESSRLQQRRAGGSTAFGLGAHGVLKALTDRWVWEQGGWCDSIRKHFGQIARTPTEAEAGRVGALLAKLLQAEVGAVEVGAVDRTTAEELLGVALLRTGLAIPQARSVHALLDPPPRRLWFTVSVAGATEEASQLGVDALIDAALLREEAWLLENEALARAARAWLGSDVEAVLATLKGSELLPLSADVRALLAADGKPIPSVRAAQLVVLEGGEPATRFLEAAFATPGVAHVLREAAPALASTAVVMNTTAVEYYAFKPGGGVDISPIDAAVRCNMARRECAYGFGTPSYGAPRYVPTLAAAAKATPVPTADALAAVGLDAPPARTRASRSAAGSADAASTVKTAAVGGRTRLPVAPPVPTAASTSGAAPMLPPLAATSAPSTRAARAARAASRGREDEEEGGAESPASDLEEEEEEEEEKEEQEGLTMRDRAWSSGCFFAWCMRDLMGALHRAMDGGDLDAIFASACGMYAFARNAYNTHGIEAELGEGCHVFLNIHGSLKADRLSNHYWLDKMVRLARPFTKGARPVLAVSDAFPVSQSVRSSALPPDRLASPFDCSHTRISFAVGLLFGARRG